MERGTDTVEGASWATGEAIVAEVDPLTQRILACAIEVHRELGPGLLESTYEAAMAIELAAAGLLFRRQVPMQVLYKGKAIAHHRLDLLVEEQVVVEIKSVDRFDPVFASQILTYMRIAKCRKGLLLNFNQKMLVEGVKRFVI